RDVTRLGFFTDNGELKIFVDGNQVISAPLGDARPTGHGVSISCTTTSAALGGPNQVPQAGRGAGAVQVPQLGGGRQAANPQNAAAQGNKDYLLALSGVRSGGSAGASRGMSLAAEDRRQFLLVPRSKQNNPPKQALGEQNG